MPALYQQLNPDHFDAIIALGNHVHGDNYLDLTALEDLYQRSWFNRINASWVAFNEGGQLLGFRLTIAAKHWLPDQWCSPELWDLHNDQVCYFKCNTVAEEARGMGIGSTLLKYSIESAKHQGAKAGLAHIWLASPQNSAYEYFSRSGGELVKEHPNKWRQLCIDDGYECPVCDYLCSCVAAEMILRFDKPSSVNK